MTVKILACWLGKTDIDVSEGKDVGHGPIANAVDANSYDKVYLLNDWKKSAANSYIKWLKEKTGHTATLCQHSLSSPTNFGEIYTAAVKVISAIFAKHGDEADLTFHLSPGTPAMAAVWIILSKTRFPAELIESSLQAGVKTVSVPFDISADFIPDLLRKPDCRLERLAAGLPSEAPEFEDLVHQSTVMQRVVLRARRAAIRSIPVLIEGESGTGKEVLSRAIHKASPRAGKQFIALNCGAIPPELIESELFGHEKSAFTGADKQKKGLFEAAHGGSLFLDEIGELPKRAQVKLLRVLQEKEIVRVGATTPIKVDVRVIGATNRRLIEEVTNGRFREDLYYRIAVATLHLPPLRERGEDVGLLIDTLLIQVNKEAKSSEPDYKHKKLSASARNFLIRHPWPGNVRELFNTLTRAAVWTANELIDEVDIQEALLPAPLGKIGYDSILNRSLDEGINLPEIINNVAVHYLKRALEKTNHNKTQTADMLGLKSYQTLTNWLKKYNLE